MKTVGVRALKQNASAVVAEAAAGGVVTITDRGRPVAQLGPLSTNRLEELLATGRVRPPKRSLADLGDPPRPSRNERRLSEVVAEMRDEDRY